MLSDVVDSPQYIKVSCASSSSRLQHLYWNVHSVRNLLTVKLSCYSTLVLFLILCQALYSDRKPGRDFGSRANTSDTACSHLPWPQDVHQIGRFGSRVSPRFQVKEPQSMITSHVFLLFSYTTAAGIQQAPAPIRKRVVTVPTHVPQRCTGTRHTLNMTCLGLCCIVDPSLSFTRLFLHTKLSNPHFPPEIQAETTLINFTVTMRGLEDQVRLRILHDVTLS